MQSTDVGQFDTWGHALAALGILVPTVFSVWFYRLSKRRERKELSYEFFSVVVASTENYPFSGDLTLMFKGQTVGAASIITVVVRNSGFAPITPDDISRPLLISLPGESAEILAIQLGRQRPRDLGVQASLSTGSKDSVVVDPLLMNSEDLFVVNILATGYKDEVSISGRITGVREIVRKTEPYTPPFPVSGILATFLVMFGSAVVSSTYLELHGHHGWAGVAMIVCVLMGFAVAMWIARSRSTRD